MRMKEKKKKLGGKKRRQIKEGRSDYLKGRRADSRAMRKNTTKEVD